MGRSVTYTYDGSGNLATVTDPAGGITRCTYDANGNVTAITHALNNARTLTYDFTFNKVTFITGPLGQTTTFTHDDHGNLVSVTDTIRCMLRLHVLPLACYPRQARLDGRDVLRPGMVRGIERRAMFREEAEAWCLSPPGRRVSRTLGPSIHKFGNESIHSVLSAERAFFAAWLRADMWT